MKDGDLATWQSHRVVVVLEGVLCTSWEHHSPLKPRIRHRGAKALPVEQWGWQRQSIKYLNNTARMQNLPIDVITFISQEVADLAAGWFEKYSVEVSSVNYVDLDQFCESLNWNYDIERVIDSDPKRIQRYGQRGYQTRLGGVF